MKKKSDCQFLQEHTWGGKKPERNAIYDSSLQMTVRFCTCNRIAFNNKA